MAASRGGGTARAVAGLLFDLLLVERKRFVACAAEHELSPMQAMTIWRLGTEGGMPMSALAEHCGCDPSNITGIVDKLETRRLIRREPSAEDRRVKRLVLTAEGTRLHGKLLERLHDPPEWVNRLSADDRRHLLEVLERGLGRARAR